MKCGLRMEILPLIITKTSGTGISMVIKIFEGDMILLFNKSNQKYLIPNGIFNYITMSGDISKVTWMFWSAP